MWEVLAIIAGLALIPLLPAYVLYRGLPADAHVEGPFHGLQIKLAGAFAGYFVLVLALAIFISQFGPKPSDYPRYVEYNLRGRIELGELNGVALNPRLLQFFLHPRFSRIEGPIEGNKFIWLSKIPVKANYAGNITLPYQSIIIEYPGYFASNIDLKIGTIRNREQEIEFEDITLHKKPVVQRGS